MTKSELEIQRQFVDVNGLKVHLRYAGTGPAVVLLHQSPQNSASMVPLLNALSHRFTVIVPDSPGYGLSDPLPKKIPTVDDFAFALAALLDVLNIESTAVVGMHTGAVFATAFAYHFPARTGLVVLDGYPVFEAQERASILEQYLPLFEPEWDGSHLTRLWTRARDQMIFFPWFDHRSCARMNYSVAPPSVLHGLCLDFLYAGASYAAGYGAAFRRHTEELINHTVESYLLYRETDPLFPHHERLPALADNHHVELLPSQHEAVRSRIIELLDTRWSNTQPAAIDVAPATHQSPSQQFIAGLATRQFGLLVNRPVLLVHDTALSCTNLCAFAQVLARYYHVVAPDLPGQGDSANVYETAPAVSIQERASALIAVLNSLQLETVDILAIGDGANIALELAKQCGERIKHLCLIDLPHRNTEEQAYINASLDDLLPMHWSGGHLAERWLIQRDSLLFTPGCCRDGKHIRVPAPSFDLRELQQDFVDSLSCGAAYAELKRMDLNYPVAERLAHIEQPVLLINPALQWNEDKTLKQVVVNSDADKIDAIQQFFQP